MTDEREALQQVIQTEITEILEANQLTGGESEIVAFVDLHAGEDWADVKAAYEELAVSLQPPDVAAEQATALVAPEPEAPVDLVAQATEEAQADLDLRIKQIRALEEAGVEGVREAATAMYADLRTQYVTNKLTQVEKTAINEKAHAEFLGRFGVDARVVMYDKEYDPALRPGYTQPEEHPVPGRRVIDVPGQQDE